MRRDHFTVDVRADSGDEGIPSLGIVYDGPSGNLCERLTTGSDGTLDASEIDITFRRQPAEERGVLSVTNRLTGEYIFEALVAADDIERLVESTEDREEPQFEVRLTDSDGKSLVYEKGTLLVYDHDGSLLRQQSLIPGGVEL